MPAAHRLRLCALLAVLATTLLLPSTGSAFTSGVQIVSLRQDDNRAQVLTDLVAAKAAGSRVVRVELRWDLLEPQRGSYDPAYLARVDEMFRAAKARGVRVAVVFLGTPCWTSTDPRVLSSGCASPPESAAFHPPADPGAYATTAAFLAKRFAPTLGWLEVWNEPDHVNEVFWGGADKAKTYAALLKAAYPAIKAASPGTKVLGGSIVGANGEFLKALYANGAKGRYDALSVHYYDLVLASVRAIRKTMRDAGDKKPLWLGEFGWATCLPKSTEGGHACVTRAAQGRNTRDVLALLRKAPYVTGAILYQVRDVPGFAFGVIDEDGRRKPSFAAAKSGFDRKARAAKPTLRLRRSGGRVTASGSGPAGDALELNVFRGGRLAYKATFRLARDRTYRLRLPKALGTSGLRVRVFQYWQNAATQKRI